MNWKATQSDTGNLTRHSGGTRCKRSAEENYRSGKGLHIDIGRFSTYQFDQLLGIAAPTNLWVFLQAFSIGS
jgi:hypothetical protein